MKVFPLERAAEKRLGRAEPPTVLGRRLGSMLPNFFACA